MIRAASSSAREIPMPGRGRIPPQSAVSAIGDSGKMLPLVGLELM